VSFTEKWRNKIRTIECDYLRCRQEIRENITRNEALWEEINILSSVI
jgi:hypothetical protein